jgi:hypothetical protein
MPLRLAVSIGSTSGCRIECPGEVHQYLGLAKSPPQDGIGAADLEDILGDIATNNGRTGHVTPVGLPAPPQRWCRDGPRSEGPCQSRPSQLPRVGRSGLAADDQRSARHTGMPPTQKKPPGSLPGPLARLFGEEYLCPNRRSRSAARTGRLPGRRAPLRHLRVLADKAHDAGWLRRQIEAASAALNIRRWSIVAGNRASVRVFTAPVTTPRGSLTVSSTSDVLPPATKSTPQTSSPCSS